jgi:hypothetical protein
MRNYPTICNSCTFPCMNKQISSLDYHNVKDVSRSMNWNKLMPCGKLDWFHRIFKIRRLNEHEYDIQRWYLQMELAYYPWFVLGQLVAAQFNIYMPTQINKTEHLSLYYYFNWWHSSQSFLYYRGLAVAQDAPPPLHTQQNGMGGKLHYVRCTVIVHQFICTWYKINFLSPQFFYWNTNFELTN